MGQSMDAECAVAEYEKWYRALSDTIHYDPKVQWTPVSDEAVAGYRRTFGRPPVEEYLPVLAPNGP